MHPVLFTLPVPWVAAFFGAVAGALVGAWAGSAGGGGRLRTGALAVGVALVGGGLGLLLWPPGAEPLPVYGYGAMLGASIVAGWFGVMALGTRRERLGREQLAGAFWVTALCALIGARALFIATNIELLMTPSRWLAIREGGLVAYGGFLGGLFGGWLYWRKRQVSLLVWGDLAAPVLGLGLGLTRIGCYLHGCDFGRPLSAGAPEWLRALGTFPEGSPAYLQALAHGLSRTARTSLPVHPTQLYESLGGFVLFAVALLVWRRRAFRGQALLAVTVLYGVLRFLLEWVRDDPQRGAAFGLSTSQLISLFLVPWAGWLYLTRLRRTDAARVDHRAPLTASGDAVEDE